MPFTLASLVLALAVASPDEPFRPLDFDAALAAAKQEGKLVFVDFFTTWCGPCKELDRTTWKDADVVAWLDEKTVPLKIDAEKEAELAKRFRIEAYPTLLFVKPDGTELDRIVGYRPPETFLKEAASTLAGKDAVERARDELVGRENDPMLRSNLADVLVQKRRYEEALAEYLWCYDHGLEHAPDFVGVRNSFLLSSIARLAREYPPALAALQERREAARTTIVASRPMPTVPVTGRPGERVGVGHPRLAGPGVEGGDEPGYTLSTEWNDAVRDLVRIDDALGRKEQTLALYDELREREELAEVRRVLVGFLVDPLVEDRRYADVVRDLGNLATWFDDELGRMGDLTENGAPMEGWEKYLRGRLLVDACRSYEALVGAGPLEGVDQPAPAELEDRILALDPDGGTYARLIQHAIRAEAFDRARALATRAESALTDEKELKRVRRAARKIPDEKQDSGT